MAINKKLITFDKKSTFLGANGINNVSSPTDGYYHNIPEWSMVFILETGEIWHNGKYFGRPIKDQIFPATSQLTKGIVFMNNDDYYYRSFNLWGNVFDGSVRDINGELVVQGETYKWTYGDSVIRKGNTNLIAFSGLSGVYDVFIPSGNLSVTGGDLKVGNNITLASTGSIKGTHILNTNSYFNLDYSLGKTWNSIKLFNTSGTLISLDSTRPAIINIQAGVYASGTNWQPWITGGDVTELSSWGIGLGGDAFYIGRISKSNTENSLSQYWKFDSEDGITISGTTKYIKVADLSGASEKIFMADGTVKALSDIASESLIGEATTTNYGGFKLTQNKSSVQQTLVSNTTGNGRYAVKMNADGTLFVEFVLANTWLPATNTQGGYVPQLSGENDAIGSSLNDYVLTFTSSDAETITPTWKRLPSNAFENTWREIKVNGTQKRSTATNSGDLNFINGTNTSVEWTEDNKLKINAIDTWNAFTAATSEAAGTAGYIQAPAGALNKFFRGDNTWLTIEQNVTSSIYFGASNGTTNAQVAVTPYLIFKEGSGYTRYKLEGAGGITISSDASGNLKFTGTAYSVFTGASSSAAGSTGLVKLPSAGDLEKFLRGDSTWLAINLNVTSALYVGASNGTGNSAQSTNGNVYLIFAEGSSYSRYKISGSGRASVTSDANGNITINSSGYSNFTAATASAAGTSGLVPAPGANILGTGGYFLRADGSWVVPTNTWKAANNSQEGYVPKLSGNGTIATQSTEYVLTFTSGGTGTITPTWKLLPTNAFANTWNLGSDLLAGYVPKATKNYFLHCNNSTGALEWVANPNTNTWRGIYIGGASKVGTGTNTLPINFVAGSNVSITYEAAGTESGQSGNAGYFNVKISATDTKYSNFVKSGSGAKAGLVPAPSTTAGTTHYLREDGTWTVPPNNNTWKAANASQEGYVPKTTANKILRTNNDGAVYWGDDSNTWKAANTSQEGYIPKLATGGGTIATQASEYVLTFKSGTDTSPVWRLLPKNAYNDHTYTVNNATYSIKSLVGSTTTTLSDFTANQSGNDDFTLAQGSNITFTVDAKNRKLTIAGTANTWKAANASQEGYVPKSTANKILRSNGDGALYWGDDANTTYTFYNLQFQNSGGTTVDTYKPTTSPTKTLKAGSNVTISAASNVITIASTNTWNANAVGVAGYVAAPTKAANANMTWQTNAEGVPAWRASNNHSHTLLKITNKITHTDELNLVDAEQATIWINYRRSGDTAATVATTQFNFCLGTAALAFASIKANGFIKNGSSSSKILLGDGTDKELTTLLTDLSRPSNTNNISLTVGGTTLTLTLGSRAFDSTSYLPLTGGTLTGAIKVTGRYQGSGADEGIIIGFASNNWATLCLGNPTGERSAMLINKGLAPNWNWKNDTIDTTITHPGKSGTIALTSDIPSLDNGYANHIKSIGTWNSDFTTFYTAYDIYAKWIDSTTCKFIFTHNNTDKIKVDLADDADTVDGKHASDFSLDGHTHNYLPLTGGTISGTTATPLTIDTTKTGNWITFLTSGTSKSYIGYEENGLCTFLLSNLGNRAVLGILDDNTPYYMPNSSLPSKKYELYHKGNFNPGDYLPLSGGTITSTSTIPLNITTSATYNYIRFGASSSWKGEIGVYHNFSGQYGMYMLLYAINGNATRTVSLREDGYLYVDNTKVSTEGHKHTWASITNKLTLANAFNFVDNEAYSTDIWMNYALSGDTATTKPTQTFHFCTGENTAKYANLKAKGYIKNGKDDTSILLAGGGDISVSSFVPMLGTLAMGNGSDAVLFSKATEFCTSTNLPYRHGLGYGTNGEEYTALFSYNGNWANILKWGYLTKYIYIARKKSGSWLSSDWEKIDAGYADSAGEVDWANVNAGSNSKGSFKITNGGLLVTGRINGSGDDEGICIGFASNNCATLILGGTTGERSGFHKLKGAAPVWAYNNGTNGYTITHPGKTGTIALTSDIPSLDNGYANHIKSIGTWSANFTTFYTAYDIYAEWINSTNCKFVFKHNNTDAVCVDKADTLYTSRTLWGQSFNGSANVDGRIIINGAANANNADKWLLKVILGTDCGSAKYDSVIFSSNDATTLRLADNDGTQWGVCVDGSNATQTSTGCFRFYTGSTANTEVWNGGGGALKLGLNYSNYDVYLNGVTYNNGNMFINGNLGVGRTSASTRLHVEWSNGGHGAIFNNTNANANGVYMTGLMAGTTKWEMGYWSGLGVYLLNHVASGAPTLVLADDGNVKATKSMYAQNFYSTSDRAKKQNISLFSEHIRKFQLKDTEKWHYGVIAQEVPEIFRDGEEGNMTVNYNSVLSYYVGQLENRVKELEDKLKKYEDKFIN